MAYTAAVHSVSVWEALFMLVVLKIPVVYLSVVVWWAIRAEPAPEGGAADEPGSLVPLTPCGWDEWRARRARRRRAARRPTRPVRPVGPPAAVLARAGR